VPAEQVGQITDGVVHLSLTRAQVDQLGEYLEPATSAEIEPDSKGGAGEALAAEARELEGKVFAPIQRREHPMNIWRRIAFSSSAAGNCAKGTSRAARRLTYSARRIAL